MSNHVDFWDFKSYDEKSWFRDLVCAISFIGLVYIGLHALLNDSSFNYEYNKLNTDQMQFVSRLYMDAVIPTNDPAIGQVPPAGGTAATHAPATPTAGGTPATHAPATPAPALANTNPNPPKVTPAGPNGVAPVAVTNRVMVYLKNVFDGEIDKDQLNHVQGFITGARAQEAISYIGNTPFRVRSYFWLSGPAVYVEVIFCALFGVFCNLLFVLGAVGNNSTTDLANPATQFDVLEILGQVAKIIYAPICTLFVVLGYSLIKGQNIVDIDLGKGLLIFGFVGGYYSSRVIALMDRLKDVLLPNTGTAALDNKGQSAVIPSVKVALALDASVPAPILAAAGAIGLKSAKVQLTLSGGGAPIAGMPSPGDPDGVFIFNNVASGSYTVSATLPVGTTTLTGTTTGSYFVGYCADTA